MATAANQLSTLNGLFKEAYADKLKELIPDGVKVLTKVKFLPKDKQPGNLYHQPVILGQEHGVTFASSDEDAFNLQPAVAGVIKDAQIKGNPVIMRSLLGYTAASRAAQGGAKAFMDATKFLVANMLRSMSKKLEIEMLYGQMGYATISSAAAAPDYTITTAEWAPGIWAGAENMPVEIRNAADTVSRGTATVTAVDMTLRTVTLDIIVPGVVATDVVWHRGAHGNEFPGVHAILVNTGTLFNINAGSFNLWKGNEYAAAGALSFAKLNKAIARAVEKGLDTGVYCLVNPRGWADLLNDQAALRRHDDSYSTGKVEVGSESIVFYSQNGKMEIVPSIYIKEGHAFLLDEASFSRVGSSDMTFKLPGQQDEFFRHLSDAAGFELRLWSDQALFCAAPGRSVIITGIVNS